MFTNSLLNHRLLYNLFSLLINNYISTEHTEHLTSLLLLTSLSTYKYWNQNFKWHSHACWVTNSATLVDQDAIVLTVDIAQVTTLEVCACVSFSALAFLYLMPVVNINKFSSTCEILFFWSGIHNKADRLTPSRMLNL